MPKEATQATWTSNEITAVFDQAFRAMEDSFRAAMKAQEDTVKLLSEAVSRANPAQAAAAEWIPTAEKNAEEYLRLLETSYERNADLLRKVIHRQAGGDGINFDRQTSEWLEAAMSVARDNAEDLASTNLRVAKAWTEAFKKGAAAAQKVQESSLRRAAWAGSSGGWGPAAESAPKAEKPARTPRQSV